MLLENLIIVMPTHARGILRCTCLPSLFVGIFKFLFWFRGYDLFFLLHSIPLMDFFLKSNRVWGLVTSAHLLMSFIPFCGVLTVRDIFVIFTKGLSQATSVFTVLPDSRNWVCYAHLGHKPSFRLGHFGGKASGNRNKIFGLLRACSGGFKPTWNNYPKGVWLGLWGSGYWVLPWKITTVLL